MGSQFGLIETFDIDDGQLEGHTPAGCFVLGYELARISEWAEHRPEAMAGLLVHASNQSRVAAALTLRNRRFRWRWPHDDQSEQWVYLDIESRGG